MSAAAATLSRGGQPPAELDGEAPGAAPTVVSVLRPGHRERDRRRRPATVRVGG